jgi:hypothetical protein
VRTAVAGLENFFEKAEKASWVSLHGLVKAPHEPAILELRCRVHNAYQAEFDDGRDFNRARVRRGMNAPATPPSANFS